MHNDTVCTLCSFFPNRTFSESLPTWSSRAVPPLVMGGNSPIVQAGHDHRSKGRCVKKWWDFLRRLCELARSFKHVFKGASLFKSL